MDCGFRFWFVMGWLCYWGFTHDWVQLHWGGRWEVGGVLCILFGAAFLLLSLSLSFSFSFSGIVMGIYICIAGGRLGSDLAGSGPVGLGNIDFSGGYIGIFYIQGVYIYIL